MKILIVDDNANNRMVLKFLLKDYAEEYRLSYDIDECENGLEALNKATQTKYNLIFMDIMMPEMDGIEATKKIREVDHHAMIIAISAVDDDDAKQKEILRNGAEDYISKPIDAEQLFARLENYLSLSSLRDKEVHVSNEKSANLYTHNVFHRQTIFYVENDEALSEFCEYYLLREEPLKVDDLSDVVRAVFAFGDAIVKLLARPWIIVEEDNDAMYFTINKIDLIGPLVVKLIMNKNKEVREYKHNNDKISFRLEKRVTQFKEQTGEVVPKKEVVEAILSCQVKDAEVTKTNVDQYAIFNYMDPDDLSEVEDLLGDLSSLMLMLGNSNLEMAEVDQITAYLQGLGKRLSVYTESYEIGRSLSSLSTEIAAHSDRFHDIAESLSTLSAAFVSDLNSWVKMTFYEGAPSIDFMNATIVANAQMISSMLSDNGSTEDEGDMDDIFDF